MAAALIQRTLKRVSGQGEMGMISTGADGVKLFWSSVTKPSAPLLYDGGIVIVFQGKKIGYLGDRQFNYCPENYLVLTLPSTFACATYGSVDEPLLGLFIDVRREDLALLAAQMKAAGHLPGSAKDEPAAAPAPMTEALHCAARRLLGCLEDPMDSLVMGPSLRREVLYHVLRGPRGPALAALLSHSGDDGRLERVIEMMQQEVSHPLSVDALARRAGMSVSAFHRSFRAKTGQPPLQYLKRLRLHTARTLIAFQGVMVSEAARRVGYESPSQFSREYKRLFGETPVQSRISAVQHHVSFEDA